jgi:hypothetical protein
MTVDEEDVVIGMPFLYSHDLFIVTLHPVLGNNCETNV